MFRPSPWWPVAELLDALYPPACRLCGAASDDGFACAEHALPAGPEGARCGRCGARLGRGLPEGFPCPECRRAPPPVARTVARLDYRDGAAKAWVLALKHRGRADLAEPLGAELARCLQQAEPEPGAWLVPVPLHPLRRFERGYDQARLLAEAVGRRARRRVVPALLRRRATAVQGEEDAPSRRANVHGAFTLDRWAARGIAGRQVWLVDDVVTSGATAHEGARVLRRAGAGPVGVLCLARAGVSSPG